MQRDSPPRGDLENGLAPTSLGLHCALPKISKIETVIRFEINTFVLVNANQEQRLPCRLLDFCCSDSA
jgi:hypothetical protein